MTRTQISLAGLAALYLLALRGCYDVVPVSAHDTPGAVYRLNRLTGGVSFCNPYVGCRPLLEGAVLTPAEASAPVKP
jgi:hypothetical protein